jgi:cell division protein FtsL
MSTRRLLPQRQLKQHRLQHPERQLRQHKQQAKQRLQRLKQHKLQQLHKVLPVPLRLLLLQ